MPKEFWVNIYEHGYVNYHDSRELAIRGASRYYKVLYRIHVKMKDNYKCQ